MKFVGAYSEDFRGSRLEKYSGVRFVGRRIEALGRL